MIKATVTLLSMLYTCANGRLPWDGGPGWDPTWDDHMPWCAASYGERPRYILCCGHTMSKAYADKLLATGVMKHGEPDKFGRPTITIGQAGRAMLDANVGRLRAAYPELARAAILGAIKRHYQTR